MNSDPWAKARRRGPVHLIGGRDDGQTQVWPTSLELGQEIDVNPGGRYLITRMQAKDDDPAAAEFWAELVDDTIGSF